MEVYTYTISTDFPNGKVDTQRLTQEIQQSSIVTAVDRIDCLGDTCDVWFKAELSAEDQSTLDGLAAVHSGEQLSQPAAPTTSNGVPYTQMQLPEGRRCDFYTPNFCDKTTWYEASERHENTEMTDSGDHLTYTLPSPYTLVDVEHGKIFTEDTLVSRYGVVVKVNEVEKTQHSPGTTDGDYGVDFSNGDVTFVTPNLETDTVTMSHSEVKTSLMKVAPPPGKKLRVGYVEVQFSKDIGPKDTLVFQMWGLAEAFAPQLGYPEGTMIPISGEEVYKTLNDFIADAEKAYPIVPVMTGAGDAWRMYQQERVIYRFDYTQRAATDMYASYGMEIRVWLKNDIPYEGEYAVGTFYGRKEDE